MKHEKHAKLIRQRYLDNMTMKEIGVANGYSRETARRRVLSAVKICKKLNPQNEGGKISLIIRFGYKNC